MYLTLKVLGSNTCFHTFFINYLRLMRVEVAGLCGRRVGVVGPCGRGAGWQAHVAEGGGGADHYADWTEFIMYCIYEYKYTKY
jgi:hypothetical protein